MADPVSTETSWISASSATSNAKSPYVDDVWQNVGNVTASDNARASVTCDDSDFSEILNCAFSGLAGALPEGATVNGVAVRVEGYASSTSGKILNEFLCSDSAFTRLAGTTGYAPSLPVGSSNEAYITQGNSTFLWGGSSISRASLVASGFRVAFLFGGFLVPSTCYIDHVQIKVYYTYTPEDEVGVALFWSAP